MALRLSCLIHGGLFLLLILLGCAVHRPVVAARALPDPEISEAKDFVAAVAGKMPMWDADAISKYERVEIAVVKADIAMAHGGKAVSNEGGRHTAIEYATKLRERLGMRWSHWTSC